VLGLSAITDVFVGSGTIVGRLTSPDMQPANARAKKTKQKHVPKFHFIFCIIPRRQKPHF
jgi:hypothetical protein